MADSGPHRINTMIAARDALAVEWLSETPAGLRARTVGRCAPDRWSASSSSATSAGRSTLRCSLLAAHRGRSGQQGSQSHPLLRRRLQSSALPRNHYDIVFFHQSLHHVGKLEKLYRAVLHALKPDVISTSMSSSARRATMDRQARAYETMLQTIPREFRRVDELPMPIQPMIVGGHPSRNHGAAPHGFEIEKMRSYGGTSVGIIARPLQHAPDELAER